MKILKRGKYRVQGEKKVQHSVSHGHGSQKNYYKLGVSTPDSYLLSKRISGNTALSCQLDFSFLIIKQGLDVTEVKKMYCAECSTTNRPLEEHCITHFLVSTDGTRLAAHLQITLRPFDATFQSSCFCGSLDVSRNSNVQLLSYRITCISKSSGLVIFDTL